MKLQVDRETDALYLRLDDSKVIESEQVAPGVVLDFNDANEVVGIEILHLSRRRSAIDVDKFVFETAAAASHR